MDVGAEYEHYTADVTRTFPVNGKFSPAQAELYQIVYDAQEAVARASKPGATLSDVSRAGTDVIKAGLLKVGSPISIRCSTVCGSCTVRHTGWE
jgi:Xaa-Pro aminopeptidase